MSDTRTIVTSGVFGLLLSGSGCAEPLVLFVTAGETGETSDDTGDTTSGGEASGTPGVDETSAMGAATGTDGPDAPEEVICGDGIVGDGEDCDDGIETATCNANCTFARCGDGIVNAPLGELCDAGGASPLCDEDCTPVACGDGSTNAAAGEECDGKNLAGESCEGLGYVIGSLACGDDCRFNVAECYVDPAEPVLELSFSQVKRFDFSWAPTGGAEYHRLEQRLPTGEFQQLGKDIAGESVSYEMPLLYRWQAIYRLQACNVESCTYSAEVEVADAIADATGYVKASNTDSGDLFGRELAVSGDGNIIAVGAPGERSSGTGINGNQVSNALSNAGAVYIYIRDEMGAWSQEAYIKASNTEFSDSFGSSITISEDGSTLAVGAVGEDSMANGIDGDQSDNSEGSSGAVYVFARDGLGLWSQDAYIKASNSGSSDFFGASVSLSGSGDTIAVGAYGEASSASGVGGDQADNTELYSGAVYIFERDGLGAWSQEAYIKASNTDSLDSFGVRVALAGDGNTLVVGATGERSQSFGVNGDQTNNSSSNAGAAYVFARDMAGGWFQQAYVKASNTGTSDSFGASLAMSENGDTLVIGATGEDSNSLSVNGEQNNNSASSSGAVYVFERDELEAWSQQAYIKASNTNSHDSFGTGLALSADGNTLFVGAPGEDSDSFGFNGNQSENTTPGSGAVYMFTRDEGDEWIQEAYIKASNTGNGDGFGDEVTVDTDGMVLMVGAVGERSIATGIGGDQDDNSASSAGAIYIF